MCNRRRLARALPGRLGLSVLSPLRLENRDPIRPSLGTEVIQKGAFCNQNRPYQICSNCVMDTTDPEIIFNEEGVCNHCSRVEKFFALFNPVGPRDVPPRVLKVRESAIKSDYDCVLGLSGGVDSSYLLIKAVEWGLRPLVVHIDAGWNAEVAVGNIFRLVDKLGVELHTEVIDWDVMRRAQIAFLRSGLANLDTPQDHVFVSSLWGVAIAEGIPTVLSGSNMATESILPRQWGYDSKDGRHIRSILRKFGEGSFKNFPTISAYEFRYGLREKYGIQVVSPLNEIAYSKSGAASELSRDFGWQDYGGKHYESLWTRYFQGHLLPYRFGYDKRKAHLSSRVWNREITREEAVSQLSEPLYGNHALELDEDFISNKLEIQRAELRRLKETPLSHYSDFPNDARKMRMVTYFKWPAARIKKSLARIHRRMKRPAR